MFTNKQKGNYGEMKMDEYYESLGYERVSQDRVTGLDDKIHQGIDGVYRNKSTGEYIVSEAKYNSGKLNFKTNQMSKEWIEKNLEKTVSAETRKAIFSSGYERNLYNIKANGAVRFDILGKVASVVP